MSYAVKKVEVWAGDFVNRPGILARVLEALTQAGARLEFLVGRRVTEHTSRIFVAPLTGKQQKSAAGAVGLVPARGMNAVRVEGPDRAGLGAEMSRAIAGHDINIRGVSAAALGRKAVFYFAFANDDEARAAMSVLRKALRKSKRR
jgi:predicted amino acid-binding ACT domain protein